MAVECGPAIFFQLFGLRFHYWHHPLRPIAAGERRIGVREDLRGNAIGVVQGIAERQSSAEGLTADEPAISTQ